jgi:hypothetical protein
VLRQRGECVLTGNFTAQDADLKPRIIPALTMDDGLLENFALISYHIKENLKKDSLYRPYYGIEDLHTLLLLSLSSYLITYTLLLSHTNAFAQHISPNDPLATCTGPMRFSSIWKEPRSKVCACVRCLALPFYKSAHSHLNTNQPSAKHALPISPISTSISKTNCILYVKHHLVLQLDNLEIVID